MAGPRIAFIGDDFTGASDTLATLARAGLRTELHLKAGRGAAHLDAYGLATALRGMGAAAIGAEMARIAPRIAAIGARYVHYKVCSTFDSGPEIGSIGAAALELERALTPVLTVVVGGQPSLGRYCLFGHLFARAADGAVHRIDRHPVMMRHPVTPMGESDLAVHLAAQGLDLARIDRLAYAEGPQALAARLAGGPARVLLDAGDAADIACIGAALDLLPAGPILLIGASGVAEALAGPGAPAVLPPTLPGPTLVFAGSRSAVTEAQVAAASGFHRLKLTPDAIHAPDALLAEARARLGQGRDVLIHLDPSAQYGRSSAALNAASVGILRAALAGRPPRRLGIAGGDTSSEICLALGFVSLSYLADLDRGVALVTARHDDPGLDGMRLMLKGGQMGGPDLFARFAAR